MISITPGGMLVHAELQKIHVPSLILGEDSLINRLRRKNALTQEPNDDAFGDSDGPPS